jgi:hypothetical protein
MGQLPSLRTVLLLPLVLVPTYFWRELFLMQSGRSSGLFSSPFPLYPYKDQTSQHDTKRDKIWQDIEWTSDSYTLKLKDKEMPRKPSIKDRHLFWASEMGI